MTDGLFIENGRGERCNAPRLRYRDFGFGRDFSPTSSSRFPQSSWRRSVWHSALA